MIIIGVTGGLGNQMFQYALYEKFKTLGKDAGLDLSFYDTNQRLRQFELDIFGAKYKLAKPRDCRKLGECSYRPADKLRRKLFGNKNTYYEENMDKGFQPEILNLEEAYLSGYWQCEKYFADIRETIIRDYTFQEPLSEASGEILKEIENTDSVSLHVRRGDYLSPENTVVYGNICTLDYYKNAITYIRERLDSPKFFIFSNDIDWVKENLYEEGMTLISSTSLKPDYEDMYLMSRCRNNIIANSSFSWWGAWLNQSEKKIVIAPDRWFANHEVSDAICSDWIKV